jgi:tyrosine-protein kinase Etk/Wzc
MSNQRETATEALVIKDFLFKVFSLKYVYIIFLVICLLLAFLINKYSQTVYEVHSIIAPVETNRSNLAGANQIFSSPGVSSQDKNLENDITSLSSFSLVSNTLTMLNLEVGYFEVNKKFFRQTHQLYLNSPFTVSIDKSHIQPINAKFYIKAINDSTFRLTMSEKEVRLYNYVDNNVVSEDNTLKIDTVCRFNKTITSNNYKFSVFYNKEFADGNQENPAVYYFEFYHQDLLSKEYLGKLKVEPVNVKSSLIKLTFKGENIWLTIDFLNKYVQNYLDDNLSKKNKIAKNQIFFIDRQITQVSDSLNLSESRLKDYRSANQVMDLSYQGQRAYEQMTQLETERSNLQVQQKYYNYILDYFNKNQDMAGLSPPSAANVTDPIMNQLILDLHTLNAERSSILSSSNQKNLFLSQIENKIKLQKQAIIENVSNNLNTLDLSLNELNARAERLSKEISRLPRTELNMVGIQRKFNMSDAIYTYLLQKRSESAITLASNYPDYEILEPARDATKAVLSPRKMMNMLIALFMGLFIPSLYIIMKDFFNTKITGVFEVEHGMNQTILSIIYSNLYQKENVVQEYPGSAISESFRNLRSSIFLKFKSEPLKIIMVTSSQPQDGKSFVSFNLATSIASVGYKTIILDCDLRRPTLHSKFKQDNSFGLSTYITDQNTKEEIIMPTSIKNLSFIPAGPVLPNSSEMIEAGALDELFNYLKTRFDYIIIDTTPAGLVADAMLMMKYSYLNLLVCRNNYTRKDVFSDVLNLFRKNNITNYDVVFNDLNINKSRYGRYNSYYRKGDNEAAAASSRGYKINLKNLFNTGRVDSKKPGWITALNNLINKPHES